MAHQLADYWPNDTIGIIKISDGGTGVRAFEKNWSFERANRTFDGKKGSAYEYFDTFKQLVSDMRSDLGSPDLPVFVLSRWNEEELLELVLSSMSDEDVLEAKKSASKPPENDIELLRALVFHLENNPSPEVKKRLARRPHILTVRMEQNRAGREIPNVNTFNHGTLPVMDDGIHLNAEGQIKLGKITATAIEEFYKASK